MSHPAIWTLPGTASVLATAEESGIPRVVIIAKLEIHGNKSLAQGR